MIVFYIFVFYRNLFIIRSLTDLQGNLRVMVGQFTHLKQVPGAIYWQLKLLHPSTSCNYIQSLSFLQRVLNLKDVVNFKVVVNVFIWLLKFIKTGHLENNQHVEIVCFSYIINANWEQGRHNGWNNYWCTRFKNLEIKIWYRSYMDTHVNTLISTANTLP